MEHIIESPPNKIAFLGPACYAAAEFWWTALRHLNLIQVTNHTNFHVRVYVFLPLLSSVGMRYWLYVSIVQKIFTMLQNTTC